ncbi:hypothetical protein [Streptomyces sp. NPDC003090]|uniref:hypothetical protein n=1 Tax=Streptomyces sp. NPDC003090 TaxID=3154274 RepID=UPI0038081224
MTSNTDPREFIRKLQDKDLSPRMRIIGMVKVLEDDPDRILFGNDCVDWIPIPVDMIESIEHAGSMRCKDHSHPLAVITFSELLSPEGRVLAQLFNSHRNAGKVGNENAVSSRGLPLGPSPCWMCQFLPLEQMVPCILSCGPYY